MIQSHEDNLKQLEAEMMAKKANMDDDLQAKLKVCECVLTSDGDLVRES